MENSELPVPQLVVSYLGGLSSEYDCDLNRLPIFEVMMRLKQRDRDGLEDILFGKWNPSNE
jgi:hypothetical protein